MFKRDYYTNGTLKINYNWNSLNQEKGTSPNKKVKRESESSGEEESDEDRPKRRGRPRMYHKETVKGFTDAEVRYIKTVWGNYGSVGRLLEDDRILKKNIRELTIIWNGQQRKSKWIVGKKGNRRLARTKKCFKQKKCWRCYRYEKWEMVDEMGTLLT